MKTALFPGSFDPFTKGHRDIVRRALESVADQVIIAVGINTDKQGRQTAQERLEAIRSLYKDEPRVKAESYEGLTTDMAQRVGADFLLRGVRNVKDLEYERDMADINRQLSGIETVLLFSQPEMACVSSSMVRELAAWGKDISQWL